MPDGKNGDMASQGVRRSLRGGSMVMDGWPGRAESCSRRYDSAVAAIASGAWKAASCAWTTAMDPGSSRPRVSAWAARRERVVMGTL